MSEYISPVLLIEQARDLKQTEVEGDSERRYGVVRIAVLSSRDVLNVAQELDGRGFHGVSLKVSVKNGDGEEREKRELEKRIERIERKMEEEKRRREEAEESKREMEERITQLEGELEEEKRRRAEAEESKRDGRTNQISGRKGIVQMKITSSIPSIIIPSSI